MKIKDVTKVKIYVKYLEKWLAFGTSYYSFKENPHFLVRMFRMKH